MPAKKETPHDSTLVAHFSTLGTKVLGRRSNAIVHAMARRIPRATFDISLYQAGEAFASPRLFPNETALRLSRCAPPCQTSAFAVALKLTWVPLCTLRRNVQA
jgi:hypothetical protein